MTDLKNSRFDSFLIPLLAIVLLASTMTLSCSSGSSPTEPVAPGSGQNAEAAGNELSGGTAGADIRVEKSTNGEDADDATGPEIPIGDPVVWTYVVTNTGSLDLTGVTLTDNQIGGIKCPKSTLKPKESMQCKAEGIAEKGQYRNVASVDGTASDKSDVHDKDRSHYIGVDPGNPDIDIEKSTNGEDADSPTGPEIPVGDPVLWTYVVTNIGDVTLTNIKVTDNEVGGIKCPKSTLKPKESMECTAEGIAEEGQYDNVGKVKGTAPDGTVVRDKDHSHYFGVDSGNPDIDIEKSTNGEDADGPTGPEIPVGDPVLWTYVVTNTGDVRLTDIEVTDDQIGDITCPQTELDPDESMECTAEGVAEAGQYENVGKVRGTAPDGTIVRDKDKSHYIGKQESGNRGCSHGYWKNHLDSWGPTGYSPQQSVVGVFSGTATWPDIANATLLEALQFGGGSGVEGAARNLMKQAVGALLNAAHPSVAFPRTESSVISSVNNALGSNNRNTILSLAGDFDDDNNLGCPLN